MRNETSSDPNVHCRKMQQRLDELIRHAREDIERVDEPRLQALLETTAEVLEGVRMAYVHYSEKREVARDGRRN